MTITNSTDIFLPELLLVDLVSVDKKLPPDKAIQLKLKKSESEDKDMLSKLANICAVSKEDDLINNLISQSFCATGFGPMINALGQYRS